ncbi:hypothetical protein GJ744_007077 [Endocarpon pusillum]|uniref:ZZ-type domain-containing protein n=1 Tax=Endocarpon pusillum TaxID=364733 RepID=A0A8H7E6N0_9EURO|nr:hypothetical protein GJ744_007077 [Endocarpon pusillum]
MEFAGLALAIPGLLTSCLDLIERVDSYKSFNIHSRQLVVRCEASKLRLQKWASSVGVSDGKLSDQHHTLLDLPEFASIVRSILLELCGIFQKSEHTRTRLEISPGQASEVSLSWPILISNDLDKAGRNVSSAKSRIAWAVKYRSQFTNQVEMFEVLVEKLYQLVPPSGGEGQIQKRQIQDNHIDAISGKYEHDFNIFMEGIKWSAGNQPYKAIDEWLDALKFDQQYDQHLSTRLEGTCDWIFQHPAYTEWVSTDYSDNAARFLWICGPAGHGKTVLCARLVQHLEELTTLPIAYVFSSSHVQAGGQPDGIIRSWISQWTKSDPAAFELVRDNLQSGKAGSVASQTEIWAVFKMIVSHVESCTCILDGFDEYTRFDDNRRDFLCKLKAAVAGTRTRCLITSRRETDIELELRSAAGNLGGHTMLECKVNKTDIQADITLYSEMVVAKKLPRKDVSLQQALAIQMAEKCEGMFLWIKLQQEHLRGGKNDKQLRKIVESMPTGLDQTYARNWTSIMKLPDDDRDRAISILRWTSLALRPLSVAELIEALVVQPDVDEVNLPVDDLPEEVDDEYIDDEIKSLCGSLVEVRSTGPNTPPSSQTIHLVHVSVKEYLLSVLPPPSGVETITTSISRDAIQNIDLAKICLRYLNFEDLWHGSNVFKGDKEYRPFLKYAAEFCFSHTHAVGANVRILNRLLNRFFEPGNANFEAWATYFESNKSEKELQLDKQPSNSLYYASLFGLTSTMEYLHDGGNTNINFAGGRFGTALQSTCVGGHLTPFNRLLEWGANVNAKGGEFGTALNAAAAGGHEVMVTQLMSREASLALTDDAGRTPLYLACRNGHTEIVRFLLEAGADISVPSKYGWTPLNSAATSGHLEVVKLLLKQGADISVPDKDGDTPLNSAASCGHLEVVKLLLAQGADMSVPDKDGNTPLNSAAICGRLEVVKLLLEQGADISVLDKDGWTPLNSAAIYGHLEVVKLLLEQGADISVPNKYGWTPLNSAASCGHLEVVKLLLAQGADMSIPDKDGDTPLNSAASCGDLEVMKLLLEQGADMSIPDKDGDTPLNSAAIYGDLEVVKLLLEQGADMSVPNKYGWTPLNSAARFGHLEVVKLLLKQGADISVLDKDGWTPLHSVAIYGHLEVIKLLLEQGADISVPNEEGWTSLNLAALNGHLEVVKLLLDREADISVSSKKGRTPLMSAANSGHLEVVRVLLDQGADMSALDADCWTPLMFAAYSGHLEVVKVLLDRGADINSLAISGATPLLTAISNGKEDLIDLFVKRGADLLIVDIYGRTCLDWLRTLGSRFEKFDQWTDGYHENTSKDKQIKHLRQSIHDISGRLIETGKDTDGRGFYALGQCLKFMGLIDEAKFAFQQQILMVDDCGLASHNVCCDICLSIPIKGIRWVCQICPDMDMCEACVKLSSLESHPVCRNHPFLEISNQDSKVTCAQSNSTNYGEINSWLRTLCSRV